MVYRTILVSEKDGVQIITLNRPERRNAMTPAMLDELLSAMQDASAGDCRVVMFAGVGSAFCAGLDLETLQTLREQSAAEHRADAERIARFFRMIYELPKPTIAVVQGAAIAGGAGLAMICDFTLSVPEAKFGFTEVRIGFVPALVSAFLALQIGDKHARDLLLTGRLFDAEEAYRLGLVTEIVQPGRLAERALELSVMLKANSPQSVTATKRLLVAQNKAWLDAAVAQALATNSEARETHDFHEGVSAFLEKRKPVWGK